MWRKRVDVSLAILLPVILGGVAMLSVLVSDQLLFGLPHSQAAEDRMFAVALICGVTVAVVGALFAVVLLRPFQRLLSSASKTLPHREPAADDASAPHALGRLGAVVDQVAEVLGALEAKALFPDIVGESRVMRGVFSQIVKVASTNATVLLTGETGVGKDVMARAIHARSHRAKGPFVTVNCAAIPSGLLESELFGHEKGAFTGAVARQVGRFELARGGTLFLDEIGDMPLAIQAKILRCIEMRECERLGGGRPIPLDVRIVAATHRDLIARIHEGLFREDLYHRLNVFPLHLPALRERREDIALLAERFLDASGRSGELTLPALQRLLAYAWPGNVRELRNVMERAAVLAGDEPIDSIHLAGLGSGLGGGGEPAPCAEHATDGDLVTRLAAYERSMIEAALSRTGGVQAQAATLLGIKERSLWHRVKKLGIQPERFKTGQR